MSSYLAEQFSIIPIATLILLEKTVKLYPEIFEFKVFVQSDNMIKQFEPVS